MRQPVPHWEWHTSTCFATCWPRKHDFSHDARGFLGHTRLNAVKDTIMHITLLP
jgi:hypothetical protein